MEGFRLILPKVIEFLNQVSGELARRVSFNKPTPCHLPTNDDIFDRLEAEIEVYCRKLNSKYPKLTGLDEFFWD